MILEREGRAYDGKGTQNSSALIGEENGGRRKEKEKKEKGSRGRLLKRKRNGE